MKQGPPLTRASEALQAAMRGAVLTAIQAPRQHDAIVAGAGAAGGLAAELLCEAGLRVLVLDASWRSTLLDAPIRRLVGGTVAGLANPAYLKVFPPSVLHKARRALRLAGGLRQPVQSQCYAWEQAPEVFVDDVEHPYVSAPGREFVWLRAHALGGRMIVPGHGRQYYRFDARDFAAEGRPAWPFAARELDQWYEAVERRLGLFGAREGHASAPDGLIANPIEATRAELALQAQIAQRWPRSETMLGRFAPPRPSLEAAAETGNLLCRVGALVRSIDVDEDGRTRGVTWFDRESGRQESARAPLVFLCASTLETTRILMQSRSARRPEGLGSCSSVLGRYLMDHLTIKLEGIGPELPGEQGLPQAGRCVYVPRFDPAASSRRFSVQIYQAAGPGGMSYFTAVAFGDMRPRSENHVTLDPVRKDRFGAPVLRIDCAHSDEERRAGAEWAAALAEIAALMKVRVTHCDAAPAPPGLAVHECGTARMGDSPASSVLDPNNQCWDASGLYVTDGASFPSLGSHNPTLTIMALTARACAHATGASDRKGSLGSQAHHAH